MKEGFDREIDSLLRRRARGTAESRSWGAGAGNGSTTDAHLDADELGAFAEGALPPSARVAAASHLADCDSCRGIVVGLARVAGAGAEVKQHAVGATGAAEPERTPAWRALIMSLFAPRVMRFAVPVLALSLVGVVSYVALRSKSGGALEMARDERRQNTTSQSEPNVSTVSTANTANANMSGLITQNTNASPREAPVSAVQNEPKGHGGAEAQPVEADRDRDEARPSAAAPAPSPPPASSVSDGPAELSKAAPKTAPAEEGEVARTENRDARTENRDKLEGRDRSGRASEPADDALSNDAGVQRRAQSRANEVQMPDGGARNSQKRADNNASSNYGGGNAGTAAPSKESESARAGAVRRERSAKQAEKKAEDDATIRVGDTRTVAGHRFRREGNAWVDVNYKNSMPSTGVRRGTEAFRALVADVPDVGRVAEAVSGEFIVVVSGRAYRIR